MTEFFDTIDTWERNLQEKDESDKVEEVEPQTIQTIIEEDEDSSERVEAIDPSDDGLFQMLNASVRSPPVMSPKKRTTSHHHHHHHHHHKANSPQRRSMKPRPHSSSESPDLPENGEGAVTTPKTETRKGKPNSSGGSTSRSHGRRGTSEKEDLSSSQKSTGSGSISRNQKTGTTTAETNRSSGRSKSQPRERGAGSRHHQTHRRERSKLTEAERQRSSSLGRKTRRQSDQSQNQLSRSCNSTSTGPSLSRTVNDDTSTKYAMTETPVEPLNTADQSPTTDDHNANGDLEDNKEVPVPPSSSRGVVAMLSLGFVSAARTTRKEAEKVVKGAAKAVTNPKEAARSVGGAASAVTTGVLNSAKTSTAESSSAEVKGQQEEHGNQDKEISRLDSGSTSIDSKSASVHHLSRHESVHSPKGTHKHHRERSRTGSGDIPSPQRPDGLKARSEHLDRNGSRHGSKATGRMTVRERRHQAVQQRNANKPESQLPKTPTETRSRTITSPTGNNLPPRNLIDRKQSGQSQGSESQISNSSRRNDDQSSEHDEDWLKARSNRQDDIMTFAKKKDTIERKPLSWNGREQEKMSEIARSPRTSKGDIKLESSHERNQEQDQERKTILTAGAKVAKVAIGVTALGAREAINAITNPKKEIEKVVRVGNKAAKKTARAASNPKETVQKMATLTQKISLGVVREATEVTKGTLQLGKETVQGTVGYVSGLIYEDEETKEDPRLKDKVEYDSQKLESRQVNASLVDRVTRVVETSDEKGKANSPVPQRSKDQRRQRAQGSNSPRPGMPAKMPSRLVVDATGKPNSAWET